MRLQMTRKIRRRSFLKGSAAAVAVAAVTPSPLDALAQLTADRNVDALVARMTLEEKIQLLHGANRRGFIGYVPAIPRLGIPELALTDGPAGVRHGPGTGFPG